MKVETKETVSQDMYSFGYEELNESFQNTVDIELEARQSLQLARCRYFLQSEATAFDVKQSKKKSYNMYALAQYFAAINKAIANPDFLQNPRKALANEFSLYKETGGIYHRNLPDNFDDVKFDLSFVNKALKIMDSMY